MFNTEINQKFNAVNGSLFKSCQKSFFIRFNLKSRMATSILTDAPKYKGFSVVVLQMMLCGDMEVLVELIHAKDYEDICNIGGKQC